MLEVILEATKSSINTDDKILYHLKQNPTTTIKDLANLLELTTRTVEKQIAKLKEDASARKAKY